MFSFFVNINIVAYLLKSKNCGARETAVASERLWDYIRFWATPRQTCSHANNVTTPVARWRKHIPAETVSIREWTVLFTRSTRSTPSSYKEDNYGNWVQSRAEAGSSTSTVALRVVGDDEKGTQCLGVKLGQGVKITNHLHLIPTLGMCGAELPPRYTS
jgi:hypothetical protein